MHLAFMTARYMDLLLKGHKTIESRFYGSARPHPAMTCRRDDEILFKRSGGDVEAISVVQNVHVFEGLTPQKMQAIEAQYNDRIQADAEFWAAKQQAVVGILIELKPVMPMQISKTLLPSSREGWIVLTPEQIAALPPMHNPPSLLTF